MLSNLVNNYILQNGNVFVDGKIIKKDIKIIEGKINKIADKIEAEEGYQIIDCHNSLISPNFVDMHVHLREPGQTDKEDIHSASLAALYGGYGYIYAMPNTNPVMDNSALIDTFNETVKEKALVHVKTYSAISKGLKGEELVNFSDIIQHNIIGFSDDGRGLQEESQMAEALRKIKENNSFVSVHAEDEKELSFPMGCVHDGILPQKYNLRGISSASEYKMVERDLKLNTEINCPYHICHISTKETVNLLEKYKKLNIDVTGEVTPHHLLFNENNVDVENSNWKMNPPLRTVEDQEALIAALNNEIIEIIATDHAPHTRLEKQKSIKTAPFGIIGLQTAFSALYTNLVKTKKVELTTILKAMTTAPAKRCHLKEYGLKENNLANLNIIKLDEKYIYNEEVNVSKAFNTPLKDEELEGKIIYNFIDGKCYDLSQKI